MDDVCKSVRIVQLQVGLHQIVCILIEHAYMCVVWQENWLIVWFSLMGKSGYIDQWVTSITFFFINFYIEIKHFPTPSCILFFSMFTSPSIKRVIFSVKVICGYFRWFRKSRWKSKKSANLQKIDTKEFLVFT